VGVKDHGFPEQFDEIAGSGFEYFSVPFVTGSDAEAANVYLMNPGQSAGSTVYGDDFILEELAGVPADHLWDIRAVGEGRYEFANAQHDPVRALTVLWDEVARNTNVATFAVTGGEAQEFDFVVAGGTSHSIRAIGAEGQCVALAPQGGNVELAPCDGDDAHQQWEFTCVSGPCAEGR
jgi:hypothetical protein